MIDIELRGAIGCGITTIGRIVENALREHGFEVNNNDPDHNEISDNLQKLRIESLIKKKH